MLPLYFIRPHEFADAALPLELLCLSFDRRRILESQNDSDDEPKRVDPYLFHISNNTYVYFHQKRKPQITDQTYLRNVLSVYGRPLLSFKIY